MCNQPGKRDRNQITKDFKCQIEKLFKKKSLSMDRYLKLLDQGNDMSRPVL